MTTEAQIRKQFKGKVIFRRIGSDSNYGLLPPSLSATIIGTDKEQTYNKLKLMEDTILDVFDDSEILLIN